MFENIGDILGKFTPQQRIIALLLILFTIAIVSVGPQMIDAIQPEVPSEYQSIVDSQNEKLRGLSSEVIRLNDEIVRGNQECTDRVVRREREILVYIDDIIRMGKSSMREKNMMVSNPTVIGNDTIVYDAMPMMIEDNTIETMVNALQTLKENVKNK